MDVKLQLEKGHIYSRVSYIKQTTLPIKANGMNKLSPYSNS